MRLMILCCNAYALLRSPHLLFTCKPNASDHLPAGAAAKTSHWVHTPGVRGSRAPIQ